MHKLSHLDHGVKECDIKCNRFSLHFFCWLPDFEKREEVWFASFFYFLRLLKSTSQLEFITVICKHFIFVIISIQFSLLLFRCGGHFLIKGFVVGVHSIAQLELFWVYHTFWCVCVWWQWCVYKRRIIIGQWHNSSHCSSTLQQLYLDFIISCYAFLGVLSSQSSSSSSSLFTRIKRDFN